MPATSAVLIAFFSSFFAAAINSTNETNKAAGMRREAVYLLRCLCLGQRKKCFVSLASAAQLAAAELTKPRCCYKSYSPQW